MYTLDSLQVNIVFTRVELEMAYSEFQCDQQNHIMRPWKDE